VTAVFVGDLISLFIAWELTAISSVFQVLAASHAWSGRAAMRYLVFQIASGMLVLAGVCMFAAATGETQFALIAPSMAGLPVGVMDISAPGAVRRLAGFGIKAAFPMVHNWLQDAYPESLGDRLRRACRPSPPSSPSMRWRDTSRVSMR